jgi:hypothetical protein
LIWCPGTHRNRVNIYTIFLIQLNKKSRETVHFQANREWTVSFWFQEFIYRKDVVMDMGAKKKDCSSLLEDANTEGNTNTLVDEIKTFLAM